MARTTDLFVVQVEKQKENLPNVLFILVPKQFANDFEVLLKKWESAKINQEKFVPKWGRMTRILHIQSLEKVALYSEDIEPITYADWANILLNQLGEHMEDEESDLAHEIEDELIYFIGEFTLLRDGNI